MNPNLAEVGKPTRWPPGKSGNPAGKPPGTRTAFSQGFISEGHKPLKDRRDEGQLVNTIHDMFEALRVAISHWSGLKRA